MVEKDLYRLVLSLEGYADESTLADRVILVTEKVAKEMRLRQKSTKLADKMIETFRNVTDISDFHRKVEGRDDL